MINNGKDVIKPNLKIVIINYEMASKFKEKLNKTNFQFIICDEAHYLKSHDALRTQSLTPIL